MTDIFKHRRLEHSNLLIRQTLRLVDIEIHWWLEDNYFHEDEK